MRTSSWAIVIVVILFCALCGWYAYNDITESKNLPQGIEEQTDFKTALVETYQSRFYIPFIAMLAFPAIVWAMAITRSVVESWFRTILSAMLATVLIFILFTNLMEDRIQAQDTQYFLPFDNVVGVAEWAAFSTLFWLACWFVVERIYVRTIAPNA